MNTRMFCLSMILGATVAGPAVLSVQAADDMKDMKAATNPSD